jgi:hypothetical protein
MNDDKEVKSVGLICASFTCNRAASASPYKQFSIYLAAVVVQSSTTKQPSRILTMDALDPSQSPHGANLLPHLPPISAEPTGIGPFPDHLEQEFANYLLTNNNRRLLSSRRRWEIKEILNHPTTLAHILFNITDPHSAELGRLRKLKVWTLRYFELDDNQIYRSAETVRDVEYSKRYALCDYDAFACIARLHRGLHHAGKNPTIFMFHKLTFE